MKTDKTVVAVLLSLFMLVLLIGWAFYQTLTLNADRVNLQTKSPQKAVVAQAQAMNEARLKELAEQGKITVGMSMEHVRLALGEPERAEKIERDGKPMTIWWYKRRDWMNIVFDEIGSVISMGNSVN